MRTPSEEVVGQDAKDTSGRCATGVRTGQVVMEEQGALTWRDGCKRTGSTVYTVLPFFMLFFALSKKWYDCRLLLTDAGGFHGTPRAGTPAFTYH